MLKIKTKDFPTVHVSHNCVEYKKLFRVGQCVKIELHYRETDDEYGSVWESAGFVTGVITGTIYRKKFWEIQLDKTVKLTRFKHGNMSEEIFVNYIKPANKIEILESEFGEVKEQIVPF